MDINKKALEMHEEYKGKIEIKSKFKLKSKEDLTLAYTPGVASVSEAISKDHSKVYNYTIKGNCVAVITDGSAVLGLGNIGAYAALPVMEGKAILLKEFANIDSFPICLDSQDTKKTIETVKNISPVFGGIILEDIKAPECFTIEESLQDLGIPVMHDDQHGTAIVVLAGLINSLRVKGLKKEEVKIVVNGVGAAGVAITKFLLLYGFESIIVVDSKGIIHKKRKDLNDSKKYLTEITNLDNIKGGLEEALIGADVFIGVSKGNLLNSEMISTMNKNPIIFALANPIPEIMPDVAKEAGAFIVATGRSDFPNQVNNVLAFPGIFRGALDIKATKITEKMKLAAATSLADLVEMPGPELILPSVFDKRVVKTISEAVKASWLKETNIRI